MCLAGHATEDTFVKLSHSQRLRAAYGGLDKELETFAGDHNSIRPRKFYTSVLVFFHRALLCEDYEVAKASLDSRSATCNTDSRSATCNTESVSKAD